VSGSGDDGEETVMSFFPLTLLSIFSSFFFPSLEHLYTINSDGDDDDHQREKPVASFEFERKNVMLFPSSVPEKVLVKQQEVIPQTRAGMKQMRMKPMRINR